MRSCLEHAGIRKRVFFQRLWMRTKWRVETTYKWYWQQRRWKCFKLSISPIAYINWEDRPKKNTRKDYIFLTGQKTTDKYKFINKTESWLILNNDVFILLRPYVLFTQFNSLKHKQNFYICSSRYTLLCLRCII